MSPLRKYQKPVEYKQVTSTADTIKMIILLGFVLLMFTL